MSDDGLMDLESDAAPVAPVEDATPPAPDPVAPPAEDEPDAVEVAGQRVVPLGVVKDLRDKVRQLTEKAEKADQLEQWQRENEPALRFLQNNKDLLVQRVQEPAPKAPAEPAFDPDAREAALLMDFYKPDGTPDDERGSRYLALQDRRAGRLADDRMRPVLQRTQQEQASANFQMARQFKDVNGESPSDASLRAVWSAMPPDLVADQQVAGVLTALALGLDRLNGPKRGPSVAVPPPALVTEGSGGNPRTRPTLSAFEERIAGERGVSATKWQENTRGFTPGRAQALED